MARERLRVEVVYQKEGAPNAPLARVPNVVSQKFGATFGDRLVWMEGCERAVQLAALKGDYEVVPLERAKSVEAQAEPSAEAETTIASDPACSLAADVERKLAERQQVKAK